MKNLGILISEYYTSRTQHVTMARPRGRVNLPEHARPSPLAREDVMQETLIRVRVRVRAYETASTVNVSAPNVNTAIDAS
jgi:hypothetical protein